MTTNISSNMLFFISLIAVFFLSLMATNAIRQYAQHSLLDIPNQRSSHLKPTPRGGGLGVVIVFFLWLLVFYYYDGLDSSMLFVFLSSLLIAGVGFWDDHQHVPARWRFLTHAGTAGVALLLMSGFPCLNIVSMTICLGLFGYIIGVLFLVWLLNLFNFMDGIDGIAASEAVFVCFSLTGFMYSVDAGIAKVAMALGVSCLGFLVCNWPPAKIFMGDVGSGFLGFLVGLLILLGSHNEPDFIYLGLILFAVFIVDASVTLSRRFAAGEKWYEAHCSHAYQHAARKHGHLKVILGVWTINLLWLLPCAYTAYIIPQFAWAVLFIACLPLTLLSYYYDAGKA